MRFVSSTLIKGLQSIRYLKAERGGGGVDERPQAMIAIAIVQQLSCVDFFTKEK
jgi:hypothetical protein